MPVKQLQGVTVRELQTGETALLSPDATQTLVLNATGGAVWHLCDGKHSAAQMVAFICATITTPDVAQVQRDVEALLAELAAAGFVTD